MLQIIGVTADLVVEGRDEAGDDERFRGRVIALAVEPTGGGPPASSSTWLLVADDGRPAPIWVSQGDVTAQRLGR